MCTITSHWTSSLINENESRILNNLKYKEKSFYLIKIHVLSINWHLISSLKYIFPIAIGFQRFAFPVSQLKNQQNTIFIDHISKKKIVLLFLKTSTCMPIQAVNNNYQRGTTRVSIVSICQSINVTPEFLNEKKSGKFY